MTHKLVIKPEAELELQEALVWHNKKKEGLGFELLQEIVDAINIVKDNPDYFQKRYKDFRISFTKRFKYGIHYTVEQKVVYIHAILHTSQKPID